MVVMIHVHCKSGYVRCHGCGYVCCSSCDNDGVVDVGCHGDGMSDVVEVWSFR